MNINDIVEDKKKGKPLQREEIDFVISAYSRGKINDSKILDFLYAINENNFSYEETYYLADAMARSGYMLNVSTLLGEVIDKHSAGSYSDATTLIFMSVLGALGVKNVKSLSNVYADFYSTLDRLREFKGFNARISRENLLKMIERTNVGLIEETENIAPVDKKLFKLAKKRNALSIPFSAASILCKKIAVGASALVFDVKTGEGAIYKSYFYAETLAKYLVNSAKLAGFKASSVITDLDWPLGSSMGTRVEVEETISVLRSERSQYSAKLLEVAKELVINALMLIDKSMTRPSAADKFDEAITSGRALQKFHEIITAYGGTYLDFKETPEKLLDGLTVSYLCSHESGYIKNIVISKLVNAYKFLKSGGKQNKNLNEGFVLLVGEGEKVNEGDKLIRIYYDINNKNFAATLDLLRDSIYIVKEKYIPKNVFYKVII